MNIEGLKKIQSIIKRILRTLEDPKSKPWPWIQLVGSKDEYELFDYEDINNLDLIEPIKKLLEESPGGRTQVFRIDDLLILKDGEKFFLLKEREE